MLPFCTRHGAFMLASCRALVAHMTENPTEKSLASIQIAEPTSLPLPEILARRVHGPEQHAEQCADYSVRLPTKTETLSSLLR